MTYCTKELKRMTWVSPYALQVRAARRAKRLTQAELAKLVGLHAQTIYRFEVGQRVPRDNTVKRLDAWLTGNGK